MRPGLISVLIADDHQPFRMGLTEILQSERDIAVVGEVASGQGALAYLDQHHVDVLVLDLRLPDMSGFEVYRRLSRRGGRPRVVMISGLDTRLALQRGQALGVAAALDKAAPPESFREAVRAAHRGVPFAGPGSPPGPPAQLTAREFEIAVLLVQGLRDAAIAAELHVSTATVRTHVRHIFAKFDITDRMTLRTKLLGVPGPRRPQPVRRGRHDG